MTGRKPIWSLILLLIAHYMQAGGSTQARLDSLFDALSAGGRTMGSICISQNGHPVYSRAIGYSVVAADHRVPASIQTRYRIASLTKMFTAVIMVQLIQEGKIDYTTTLDGYFPGLPGAKDITIAMLLSHRSGLYNILDDPDWPTWKVQPKTHEEIIAMIGRSPLAFAPGTKASYSNSNYILLGYIIEAICHKTYSEAVTARILAPLGLHDTYYGGATDTIRHECYSYTYTTGWIHEPEADMSILGGAGGLVSSPADLDRFLHALYSRKLVRTRYLAKMEDITDGYGMGLIPFSYGALTGYGHHGSIDGFSSLAEYFPGDGIALSYCSNGQTAQVTDIVASVVHILFDGTELN
jgi:CubicO group peptidase (beta-lactamase class C family)